MAKRDKLKEAIYHYRVNTDFHLRALKEVDETVARSNEADVIALTDAIDRLQDVLIGMLVEPID